VLALAWLVVAALVSAGAAGVVASVGGPPGATARPELTWAGDGAIQPGFDAALGDLRALSTQVDRLGTLGRGALAALSARDETQLASIIDDGSTLVGSIDSSATAIRSRLRALPGTNGIAPPLPATADLVLGQRSQERYAALDDAVSTTEGLSGAWVRLTAGSLAAIRLSSSLGEHDASTAAAARLGRGGHYARALNQLMTSSSLIADARKQRDTLENTVDVTTLTRWIDLNAAYDATLVKLYQALLKSKGRATSDVRQAVAAEAKAHAQLPPDTRGLVVIMGEIARGGLNQAVIAIEDARGSLADAIDALTVAADSGTPGASDEPSPSR